MVCSPLERRDVFQGLAGFGERAVGGEALVVQQLSHGDVGQLLHQFEGLVDVEEHGKEVLSVACAHADALGENQSGILVQLCDVSPLHHQRN